MSSRYNTGRKVQPHPPFCYSHKPGRQDVLPCDHGPAIGPSPFVVLRIRDNRTPIERALIITGRLSVFAAPTTYTGRGTGADGSQWNVNFTFLCDVKVFDFNADTIDPRWGPISFAANPALPYNGPKQFDTGWLPMLSSPPTPGLSTTGRIYL